MKKSLILIALAIAVLNGCRGKQDKGMTDTTIATTTTTITNTKTKTVADTPKDITRKDTVAAPTQIMPPAAVANPLTVTLSTDPVVVFVYFAPANPANIQTVSIGGSAVAASNTGPYNSLWQGTGAIQITAADGAGAYNSVVSNPIQPPSQALPNVLGWDVTVFSDAQGNKAIICVADAQGQP
jgi:hypothetical protein